MATAAFYEEVLGARRVFEEDVRGVPVVRLDLAGLWVTISDVLDPAVGHHIGLEVDDFELALESLARNRVEIVVPPRDLGTAKVVFVRDPAGSVIEIIERITVPAYKSRESR